MPPEGSEAMTEWQRQAAYCVIVLGVLIVIAVGILP
jgi:hypothetical protein